MWTVLVPCLTVLGLSLPQGLLAVSQEHQATRGHRSTRGARDSTPSAVQSVRRLSRLGSAAAFRDCDGTRIASQPLAGQRAVAGKRVQSCRV